METEAEWCVYVNDSHLEFFDNFYMHLGKHHNFCDIEIYKTIVITMILYLSKLFYARKKRSKMINQNFVSILCQQDL